MHKLWGDFDGCEEIGLRLFLMSVFTWESLKSGRINLDLFPTFSMLLSSCVSTLLFPSEGWFGTIIFSKFKTSEIYCILSYYLVNIIKYIAK